MPRFFVVGCHSPNDAGFLVVSLPLVSA